MSLTFVHKLYNMVYDEYYQNLIAWSYTGNSFIVCNIKEFSSAVLPKHFKHNNFNSFIRQLNMYGFNKVNKSLKSQRISTEYQIWEFSHPNFIKERPDLLNQIKRKTSSTSTSNINNNDYSVLFDLKSNQSEMLLQLANLNNHFSQILVELTHTKQEQENQLGYMKQMLNFISLQNNSQLPNELIQYHHLIDYPFILLDKI